MGRNIYWGVALLLVGLLLLASNLGYIEPFSAWGLWPILIIVPALKFAVGHMFIHLGHLPHAQIRVGRGLGTRIIALWVLAGAGAQLLHNVNLIPYDWGYVAYWTLPLLLVGIGIAIIARPKRRAWEWSWAGHQGTYYSGTRRRRRRSVDQEPEGSFTETTQTTETTDTGDGSSVSSFVGDLRFGARPWVFKSPMNLKLWAGDIDMDLTTATFEPGDNFLTVKSWAGDLEICAPRDTDVYVEARCAGGQMHVFGEHREGMSIEIKTHRPPRADGAAGWDDAGGDDVVSSDEAFTGEPGEATTGAFAAQKNRLFIGIEMNFGNIRVR